MNFNRIQKYRSQKAISQLNYTKNARPNIGKQSVQQFTKNNRSIEQHRKEQTITKNQQQTNDSQNSYLNAKGITLRDYLYLTSTTSKKSSSIEKSKNSSVQSKRNNSKDEKQKHKRSISLTRKQKYQASNTQIFEIVKKDVVKDIAGLQSLAQQLELNFNNNVQYHGLNNAKMIEIYNFRKILRENILGQVKKLNNMIIGLRDNSKYHEKPQMPIIFQEEEEKKHQGPIQISSNVVFEEVNARHFLNRTYSLKN